MRYITYDDILKESVKRNSNIPTDDVVISNCEFYNKRLLESNTDYNAELFIRECSKSIYTCNKFLPQIVSTINGHSNLLKIFEGSILNKLINPSKPLINSIKAPKKDKEFINEAVNISTNCNRIINNHNDINKEYNISKFISECTDNNILCAVYKCCNIINNHFDLPVYGKINIAIEEVMYNLDKEDRKYSKQEIVEAAQNYFAINDPNSINNIENINSSLSKSKYIHEDTNDNIKNDTETSILGDDDYNQAIEVFLISPVKTYDMITSICDELLSVSNYSFKSSFEKLLETLDLFIIVDNFYDIKDHMCVDLADYIYNKLYELKGNDLSFRDIVKSAIDDLKEDINRLEIYKSKFSDDLELSDSINNYQLSVITKLYNDLTDIYNSLYPKENIESMTEGFSSLVSSASNAIGKGLSSVGHKLGGEIAGYNNKVKSKEYTPSNIISAVYGIDHYLSNKLQNGVNSFGIKLKELKHKIYNESNMYDYITPSGDIDYTVESYELPEGLNYKVHDMFNGFCKEINETILDDSNFKCYYETTLNEVTVHVRDTKTDIDLDENDIDILSKYIREEDQRHIKEITDISNMGNLGFGLSEAIDIFSNCEYPEVFSTFAEACKLAGVSEKAVQYIYTEANNNMNFENRIAFHNYNDADMLNYHIVEDADDSVRFNACKMLYNIIYESYDDEDEDPNDEFGDKYKDVKDSDKSNDESKSRHNDYVIGKNPEDHTYDSKYHHKKDNVSSNEYSKGENFTNKTPIERVTSVANNASNAYKTLSGNVKKSIDKIQSNSQKVAKTATALKAKAMHESNYDDEDEDDDDYFEEKRKANKPTNVNKSQSIHKKPVNNTNHNKNNNSNLESNKDKPINKNGDDKKHFDAAKFVNNIQLSLKGLATGAKDLSSKEQNACHNFDSAVNSFTNSMKSAAVQERREAIIKGQLFPSFSKALKAFIPIAGIAAAGHPIAAIISAFGALAMTKSFDKKERNLMLDDLEVELKILDKEIQNADANGQMKKYRALLRTQKQLQREYQNIKYNLKFGKNVLPSSHIGVASSSDED